MEDKSGSVRAARVTHKDIAHHLGISRATVSYVLNNTPNHSISTTTRKKVIEAAERLGHVPYAPARALRSGRSEIVIVLVPGFTVGLLFEELISRLDSALAEVGYGLLLHRHDESKMSIARLWGIVSPELVVVLGGLDTAQLDAVRRATPQLIEFTGLAPDSDIGRTQAEYLISKGHTRIGFAYPSDPTLDAFARGRLEGVRAVCREHGVLPPSVRLVDLDADSASEALASWHAEGDVTAVCAHNDDLGLILLGSNNRRVGERDIAIIGADDIPMSRIGLTTVSIDVEITRSLLVSAVLARLHGTTPPTARPVPMRVITRSSA